MDVIDHYNRGGVKNGLDPNMFALELSIDEKQDLRAFLKALNTRHKPFIFPVLFED